MLDLETIKKNTLWVARMVSGVRFTGTYDEIKKYEHRDDCKDVDILASGGQPKELQEFYKAYEYATFYMNRHDLFLIDDFYKEWSKNPNQFRPEMRPVIGKLSDVFERQSGDPKEINVLIKNYDKKCIGNHLLSSWIKTLKILETDYDIVEVTEDYDNITIIVQTDEENADIFYQKANDVARQEMLGY